MSPYINFISYHNIKICIMIIQHINNITHHYFVFGCMSTYIAIGKDMKKWSTNTRPWLIYMCQIQIDRFSKVNMTKIQNRLENGLVNGLAQFHWKALLYHCRLVLQIQEWYNTNIAYINCLQKCPWSLVSQHITQYYYLLRLSQPLCTYQLSALA